MTTLKALAKIALFFILVATVCIVVGVATPEWLSKSRHYQGLWKYCYYLTHSGGDRTCTELGARPDFENWIQAVRVLVIMSFVMLLIDFIIMIFYIKKEDGRANLNRIRSAILISILSVMCCFIGIIVYAVQKNNGHFSKGYSFSWSFILTIIGGGVTTLVPVLLFLEIRRSRELGSYESI